MNLRIISRAIRIHQWVKNLLLFLPLIMAHKVGDTRLLLTAFLSFLAFSFCASGVYLINDILDLEADKEHTYKKHRPIASGKLSIELARAISGVLFLGSFILAWMLSSEFLGILLIYALTTFLYSLYLKKVVVADIIVLAALYTIRILAGGVVTQVSVSQWLLGFSMFFFLSLACMKRYSELRALRLANKQESQGRGYVASDLEQISQFGSASGYLSVLVLALYVSSKEVMVLYRHPQIIWLVCPLLLYWISRVWLLAHRGDMHEDPIVFAITDKVSYLMGAMLGLVLLLAV